MQMKCDHSTHVMHLSVTDHSAAEVASIMRDGDWCYARNRNHAMHDDDETCITWMAPLASRTCRGDLRDRKNDFDVSEGLPCWITSAILMQDVSSLPVVCNLEIPNRAPWRRT